MNNKKIFRVKLKYFEHFLEKKLTIPCIGIEYGTFFFLWSLETTKQFMKHLMTMQPTKFYISSISEVESITTKTDIFQKIMDKYNKIGNKKIDKFELVSIIPFIVVDNFDVSLSSSLTYFCLENENLDIITKNELGLFIDSFFRAVHNLILFDEKDDLYSKTKTQVLKLSENEIDDLVNKVFKNDEEELPICDIIRKLPDNLKNIMVSINTGLYQSLKYYEKKIKEENLENK